jgi:hypothetical protein
MLLNVRFTYSLITNDIAFIIKRGKIGIYTKELL